MLGDRWSREIFERHADEFTDEGADLPSQRSSADVGSSGKAWVYTRDSGWGGGLLGFRALSIKPACEATSGAPDE